MRFVDDIIRLLRDYPENWIPGRHYIEWKCDGPRLRIWICNSGWFCDTYESGYPPLPVLQRWRIWFAFKRWRKKYMRVPDRLPNKCCTDSGAGSPSTQGGGKHE